MDKHGPRADASGSEGHDARRQLLRSSGHSQVPRRRSPTVKSAVGWEPEEYSDSSAPGARQIATRSPILVTAVSRSSVTPLFVLLLLLGGTLRLPVSSVPLSLSHPSSVPSPPFPVPSSDVSGHYLDGPVQAVRDRTRLAVPVTTSLRLYPSSQTQLDIAEPLVWSTLLGTPEHEWCGDIALFSNGSIVVSGSTMGVDFPDPEAPDIYRDPIGFVVSFSRPCEPPMRSWLIGNEDSYSYNDCMAVDEHGRIFVAGYVWGQNFPRVNANETWLPGTNDNVYVVVYSPDGQMLFSTLIGGSGYDYPYSIVLGPDGILYVVGSTSSVDFPVTSTHWGYRAGPSDVFVMAIDCLNDRLVFSRCLGGEGRDSGKAVTMDADGAIWVTGWTDSEFFESTLDGWGSCGGTDVFVARLDRSGVLDGLLVLGGGGEENALGIAVTDDNSVIIAGWSNSTDLPAPVDDAEEEPPINQGGHDVLLLRMGMSEEDAETTLDRAVEVRQVVLIGGSDDDYASAIALGQDGSVYIAGWSDSEDFPVAGTFTLPHTHSSHSDCLVMKMSPDLSRVLYASCLGGPYPDEAYSLVVNGTGTVFVAGTGLDGMPLRGAFDNTTGFRDDVVVFALLDHADGDADDLIDHFEYLYGTSPSLNDTDGDGLTDRYELEMGLDPLNPDCDNDGLDDGTEVRAGLNPLDGRDAGLDLDGDGLTTAEEIALGLNPLNWDTDGDGFGDGWEVARGYDPRDRNVPLAEAIEGWAESAVAMSGGPIVLAVLSTVLPLVIAVVVLRRREMMQRRALEKAKKREREVLHELVSGEIDDEGSTQPWD